MTCGMKDYPALWNESLLALLELRLLTKSGSWATSHVHHKGNRLNQGRTQNSHVSRYCLSLVRDAIGLSGTLGIH